jgi:hypothetical protein
MSLSEWRRYHPDRCEACGTVLTGAESSECPSLCDECASTVDQATDELLQRRADAEAFPNGGLW